MTGGGDPLQPLRPQQGQVDGRGGDQQALRLPAPAADVLRSLAAHNILGGYDLGTDYPELGPAILVCATELRAEEDIAAYATKLARVIATRTQARCPVEPKF